MSNTSYEIRKAEGLCTGCGGSRDNSTLKCDNCKEKAKQWRKANPERLAELDKLNRQRRKKIGKCASCNNPAAPGSTYCQEHLEGNKKKRQEKTQERENAGLCIQCGCELEGNSGKHCDACLEKNNASTLRSRNNRKEKGLCVDCGVNSIFGKGIRCTNCKEKEKLKTRLRQKDKKVRGECSDCSNSSLANNRRCEACWFRSIAVSNGLQSSDAPLLKALWEEQNGICAYTKQELVMGNGVSLDHVIPRSKGGSNDISNLRWVILIANKAKQDLLNEQFYNLIQDLFYNYKLES